MLISTAVGALSNWGIGPNGLGKYLRQTDSFKADGHRNNGALEKLGTRLEQRDRDDISR